MLPVLGLHMTDISVPETRPGITPFSFALLNLHRHISTAAIFPINKSELECTLIMFLNIIVDPLKPIKNVFLPINIFVLQTPENYLTENINSYNFRTTKATRGC